jgi:hypothetical protein
MPADRLSIIAHVSRLDAATKSLPAARLATIYDGYFNISCLHVRA